MAGVIQENGFAAGRLKRFGYIHLKAQRDSVFLKQGEELRGTNFIIGTVRTTEATALP